VDAAELAFFGRVAADVSHEIRNVLSVIGEYAGLLDDLVALAERGKPLGHEKLRQLSARMTRQVGRGTETMERFSRFAHATDERTASFDLTSLAANTAALAQRRVKLSGCMLQAELPRAAIPVRSSPFSVQHAVFAAIELLVEVLGEGSQVTMKLAGEGTTAVICLSAGAAGGDKLLGRISQLSALMSGLEGDVATSSADGTVSLTLSIPTC
jgi:signal transduction histidine kinase